MSFSPPRPARRRSEVAGSFLTRPIFGDGEVRALFGDAALIRKMVDVEIALAGVQARLGVVPKEAADTIARAAEALEIPAEDLAQGVAASGVPVPALVGALREAIEGEAADAVHFGATSQDIVDTALNLCYRDALDVVETRLAQVIDSLVSESRAHRETLMLARTRGQLATPITLGLRIAQWAQPLIALESESVEVRRRALRVQFGGASGNRAAAPEGAATSRGLAEALGLSNSPPWHTDRSGLMRLARWLHSVVAALAKIGGDLRLSARSEIGEIRAGSVGGSSTMPHKSNPVTAEALGSLGAVATAQLSGLAGAATHAEERDGAMWPVEWLLLPDLFETTAAALAHAGALIGSLRVDAGAMRDRIEGTPEVMAEAAVFALAGKIGRGAASKAVAEALASEKSLAEALVEQDHSGVDWPTVLDPETAVVPSAEVADRILALRGRTD